MTLKNDGSISGSPCHCCDGKLALKPVPNGGFILGCSEYKATRCTFTMEPNSDEISTINAYKEAKRVAREARRVAKQEAEDEKARVKALAEDVFCIKCGAALTTVRRYAKLTTCARC